MDYNNQQYLSIIKVHNEARNVGAMFHRFVAAPHSAFRDLLGLVYFISQFFLDYNF